METENFCLTQAGKTQFTTELGIVARRASRGLQRAGRRVKKGTGNRVKSIEGAVRKLVEGRRLLASALLAMMAIGLCTHAVTGENGWISYRHKRAEYQRLQKQLQGLDEENRRLDEEIKALKSDPKAIEKEAREQLRYAKPGEVIYLLPEQPGASTPQAVARR